MTNFKKFPVEIYPKRGMIKDYIDYVDPTTEAPEHFHFFVATSLISAVLGRKIYLPWGTRNLFPNTYVTLIGNSTVTRKTTSIDAGKAILSELEVESNTISSGKYLYKFTAGTYSESGRFILVK